MAERNLGSLFASLELRTDKFEKGLKNAKKYTKEQTTSFTELNQSLELASKGFELVAGSFEKLKAVTARGQDVFEMKNAFADLQAQAGRTADEGIAKLRNATQGMLADFELMKSANVASSFGATQQQFELLAGSADKLGGAVGKSLPDALNILNEAFGRGKLKMMEQLNIKVLLSAEEEEYRKNLDQTGELLFNRAKIIEAVAAHEANLSEATQTAGDAFEIFDATLQNAKDTIALGATNSTELRDVLLSLNDVVKGLIPEINNFFLGVSTFANAIKEAKDEVSNFVDAAGKIPGVSDAFSKLWNVSSAPLKAVFGVIEDGLDTIAEKGANKQFSEALDMKALADSASSLEKIGEALKKVREEQDRVYSALGDPSKQLSKDVADAAYARFDSLEKIINSLDEKQKSLSNTTGELTENQKKAKDIADKLREATRQHIDTTKDAEKAAKDQAAAIKKLNDSYEDTVRSTERNRLNEALQSALEVGDLQAINDLKTKISENVSAGYLAGLGDAFDKATPEARAKAEETARLLGEASQREIDKSVSEKLKQSFQESIDFFGDIFTPMLEDQAANFEDIFTDAAKRIAIGFASSLAASLAQAAGFNTSGITGASGVGQLLGSTVASSLGLPTLSGTSSGLLTSVGIGSVGAYGSGVSAGLSGAAAPGALGTAAASGTTAGAAYAGLGAGSSVAMAVPYVAAAAAAYYVLDKAGVFEGNFGGTTNAETLARRNARSQLQQTGLGEDLTFSGVRGKTSIFGSDYSLTNKNSMTDFAVGLANPLAMTQAGGSGKLASDLAGMFADATDNAGNFNEVLINTMSLMDQMGVNAEDQKNELTSLFLEGKVSLDELTAGVASLNLIAQDNLIGTGSVSDAMSVLAQNITEGPGIALKGLELALKEASELGINDIGGLANYISDKAGPNVVSAFHAIQAAGISTFDDVKNASSDQIVAIFNALTGVQDDLVQAFANAANEFSNTTDQIIDDAQRAENALNGTTSGGTNGNQALGAGFDSHGVRMFRTGGLVTGRTLFKHAGGIGMMGEAGPEFIVPADRMSNGKLGINARGIGGTSVTYVVNAPNAQAGVEEKIVEALKLVHQKAVSDSVFAIQDMQARGVIR